MLKSISINTLTTKRQELSDSEFLEWLDKEYGVRKELKSYEFCPCNDKEKETCLLCPNGLGWYETIS